MNTLTYMLHARSVCLAFDAFASSFKPEISESENTLLAIGYYG